MLKQPKVRDKNHRRWISTLDCCACGVGDLSQAAHIKNSSGTAGAGDDHCVPLCCSSPDRPGCHHRQHMMGSEEKFWKDYGGMESALELASSLYKHSGNDDVGKILVEEWKR